MKFIERFTMRGQINESGTAMKRIPIYNGTYNQGIKVVDFQIATVDRDNTSTYVIHSMLATEELDDIKEWNWSDNRQIAWNRTSEDGNSSVVSSPPLTVIDPENMAVEDLYVGIYIYGGSGELVNYMVTVERYALEPFQGTLGIVGNMSQG